MLVVIIRSLEFSSVATDDKMTKALAPKSLKALSGKQLEELPEFPGLDTKTL